LTEDGWIFEVSDDICHYYCEDQYYDVSGSLGSSCMKYSGLQDCIKFYYNYNAKILVLKNSYDTIKGRAIVWENVYFKKLEKNLNFMDRVYTNDDNDVELFIDYARKNGWVWKNRQSMSEKSSFRHDGDLFFDTIEISPKDYFDIEDCRAPYMDTMTYADYNGCLSNDDNIGHFVLEDTNGNVLGGTICSCCENSVNEDSVYFNDNGECLCDECFHEHYFYCEDCEEVTDRESGTYIENHGMICEYCRDKNYTFCEECEEHFYTEDGSYETVDGEMICKHCAENKYKECEECGLYEKPRYMTEIEDGWYCNECAMEIEKEKEAENE